MEPKNPFSALPLFISKLSPELPEIHAGLRNGGYVSGLFNNLNMMKKVLSLLFFLFIIARASSQVDGDYQTRATGNWNSNATWQVRSGGAWVNCVAGDYPGAAAGAGTVYINGNNTVTLNLSPANAIGAITYSTGNIALSSIIFGGNFTLNVTGDINYTLPGVNANGDQTLNVATGILNCNNVTMVTTADNARMQSLLLSTGTINASGSITMSTATQNVITVSGAGIINIGGNFTPGTGNFSAGTGLVNYNGTNQNVAGLTYYDLTISGSGNKTLQGNLVVGRALAVNAGTLDFGDLGIRNVTVAGDLSGAGSIDMASGLSLAHQMTLNGTNNAIGNFISGSGTVIYSRNGVQQIFAGTYYNLTTQTNNQVRTIQGDITVNNNLTISSGTFNYGIATPQNVLVQGNLSGAGTINMTGGALGHTLTLNGTNNAITTFAAGSGTVIYSGGAAQQIFGGTYNNLTTQTNDQVRTIQGSVIVNGNLTITAGTFNFGNVLRTVTVTGDLTGAGSIDMSGGPVLHVLNLNGANNAIGAFSTATVASVVNYGRAGAQFIFASPNYRNLFISNGGDKTIQGDVTAGGILTFNNGRIILGANSLTLTGTAAVAGPTAARYVVADGTGQLRKVFAAGATGAYLLPVGDAVNYSPANITFTANSTQRTIGLRVTDAQHPSDGTATDYISRYWSFTDDQVGTYTYNATFTFVPADQVGVYLNMRVNRWNTGSWTQYNTAGPTPSITVTGVSETTALLNGSDFTGRVNGAGTYNWNQTDATASYIIPSNWTPARLSPQPTDILVFDNNGTTTATNVPAQTIGQLILSTNSNVSLQSAAAAQTLTISGGAGTDLVIGAGSVLQLSSTAANQIGVSFGPVTQDALIAGDLRINANGAFANSYNATNSVTTVTGSITNNGGNITSTAVTLVFNAAAAYNHTRDAGTMPVATWNSTSVINITGTTATAPTGFSQDFGHVNIICPSLTGARTIALGGNTTIQGNLNIAGTSAVNTISLNASASNLTVNGTSIIGAFGIISDNNNTGANRFDQLVTINANGTFITGNNSTYEFRSGIANNGTFTKGGAGSTTFAVNPSQPLSGSSVFTFTGGDIIIPDPASLDISASISFSGTNITSNTNAVNSINASAGTFTFGLAGNQFINGAGTGAITLFNLIAGGNSTKTLNIPVTVSGDVTINNGVILSLGTTSKTINVLGNMTIDGSLDFGTVSSKIFNLTGDLSDVTGVITMTGAALSHQLNLNGTANALTTLNTTVGSGSTINYIRGGDQQVFGSTNYQNLNISGGGIKSLQNNATINGQITLTDGVLRLGTFNLTIANNATNAIQGTFSQTNMVETNSTGALIRNALTVLPITFPVGSGGFYSPMSITAISATTGNIRVIAVPAALGSNFVARYWDVITSTGGKTISATFTYDPAELGVIPTNIWYRTPIGSWSAPTGTAGFGANSFSVTGTTTITTTSTYWTASRLGTYYSYQTGDWDTPNTWTSDPSGTLQIGTTIPGINDKVVILTGRTVSLSSDVATQGLDITIDAGGYLDMTDHLLSGTLAALRGQGTLKLATANFPAATINTIVNAGGGTTEYNNMADFDLPATQLTYNNLTINAPAVTATQLNNIVLNGNLIVRQGNYRINDNTSVTRLTLTINGSVTVDIDGAISVGNGATNPVIGSVTAGGIAPFLNYYTYFHTVIIRGDFVNNGTVRFTNLPYPVYNAFPSTVPDATTGAASVFFQGASNNVLTCNGTTDFYNLILDKGSDQTNRLTLSSNNYYNFRLYGANTLTGEAAGSNANLRKALWIRTGTLVLEGSVVIPSLTEGVTAGPPSSDFYIPSNGGLIMNSADVIILSTADDYREVNTAYNVSGTDNLSMGITSGGNSALVIYGNLQVNNGFLSTRESGGLITSNVASGQIVINGGTVDTKQLLASTGSAQYSQSGGQILLRGRLQRTPAAFASISDLTDVSVASLNTSRAANAISSGFGTFNLENATNVFSISGGTIRVYDVAGTGAGEEEAFDVKSSSANINVTGGTLEIIPATGTAMPDAVNFSVFTNAPVGNMLIDRIGSSSIVFLNTPLIVQNDLTINSGDLSAGINNVTIGGNFTLESGTTYNAGTNTTSLNGAAVQTITVNLAAPLVFTNLTLDKPSGIATNLAGTQNTINVNGNLRNVLGTLNDNGKIINVTGNVFNSGVHAGAGRIVLNGTAVQTIDGNGVFENVELNNTNAATAPVSLAANMTLNGELRFSQDKLFNIGTYNLRFNASGTVTGADLLRYVQTGGNAGDGGMTKVYSSPAAFTFSVGAPTIVPARPVKYTPASIGFSSAPAGYGSVTVVPVGYEHPSTTVNGQSLTYFWRVRSSGFSGIVPNSVVHSFTYDESDVVGTEANYIPSLYTTTDFTWRNGSNSNPPIDIASNLITDWTNPTNSADFLDADYTAGEAAFGVPQIYYSRQNGAWGILATWSLTSHTVDNLPATVPGINDIVIIGGQDSVHLATDLLVANAGVQNCANLQIERGSALDIGYNPGCSFGTVSSHPSGNGNFRLTTTQTSGAIFNFPAGDFSDFNVNRGTTEFYTTNGGGGTIFILPYNITSYGTVILSPLGGSNIILPNNNSTTIYGDLITRGQDARSWLTMTWPGAIYANSNPALAIVPKTVYVRGNLLVQGGSFGWIQNGAVAQNIEIDGDIVVATLAGIDDWGGATNQTITLGGSLINNANGLINPPSTTRAWTRLANIPIIFNGNNPASITNTSGTPSTIFGRVTVNKGISQATTLTLNVAGTLTTPADNWLILQNGTFRYMRTNPGADFTISTTTPFTIPETAGLYIDYANSGNRNILIGNSNSNTNDLFLDGKLTLLSGNIYIGPTGGPGNNNDIEYSGGGNSAIEIAGGNLTVNGQIRRPAATTNGILSYVQTGGNVIINGNSQLATKAKLEVLNTGSVFNMSGGTITIVRGGGTTFGDLYLRPENSSVSGGTITFAHNLNGANQTYGLEANVPLNDMVITGRTVAAAANATVNLLVSPLVLNGSLTLSNIRSIFNSSNLNVTIGGNLANDGAYNYGTNLTTFKGGTQTITGATVTNFYDLDVNPVTSLTVNNDFNITRNLTISSGNLVLGNRRVTLTGNLINNGSYTDDNTTGGVSLSGAAIQQITGTGSFGRLELNNASGAKINNDITLQNDLVLTQGVLDISKYRITLSQNSAIGGAPFSLTKYIRSDGVISSLGIRKFFTAAAQLFTFPIGVPGKYTQADLTITSSATVGYIDINPVNNSHPSVTDPARVLNYYWKIGSSGISAFDGTFILNYRNSDVSGTESSYVAARLELPGNNWIKAPVGPGTDNVNEATDAITFAFTGSNNLNGDYTAGEDSAIPGAVATYQTNMNGNWSDPSIWTPVGGSPACPAGGPVGANVIIDHIVTTDVNNIFVLSTLINNRLRVVSPTFGHNLGNVDGDGTIYLENGNLPGGDYTAFLDCAGNGTIEYGGTGSYTIIASQFSSIPNMFITGTGSRILPNKDLTICKRLVIDGPALDNSVNARKLIILGTMERYNAGSFLSGTGLAPAATVTFAGSAAQTLGGPTGDFTGTNRFNNLEIANASGLTIGAGGQIDVNTELLLTNGIITTSTANRLTLLSTSSTAVVPAGGSAASFVSGPLIKQILNGGSFLYPIGKGATKGHGLTLTSTSGSTLFWTAEYFTPNPTATSLNSPLQVANKLEYWNVRTTIATTARIKLAWDPLSDLTPLMTQNGLSDMRVAEYGGTLWNELGSIPSGDVNNGDVATTNNVNITATDKSYTIASISTTLARASLNPSGPVCGVAGIPVSFTSSTPITLNYILDYTVNGAAQPPVTISSLPYTLPTPFPGAYRLTGFRYNNGATTGVVDGTAVNVYAIPTLSNAGPDQSLCGVSGTMLAGNSPAPYTGLWTVLSGTGGTFVNSTVNNTVFTGVLGQTYTLRWTISNFTCTSSDDVVISFPVVAPMPGPFTSGPTQVCQGSGGYIYTVPVDPGVTYTWSYTGSGQTIAGTGNSVTVSFNAAATSGILNVTATNACGTSAPRTIGITVNPIPAPSVSGDNDVCPNETGVIYSTTNNPGSVYAWVVSGGVISGSSTGSSITVNWGAAGAGSVRVTETSPAGCTFTTAAYPVQIRDLIAPVISGCPANINVNNDPGLCTALVVWIEPTATDNCTASGSLIWTRSHIPGSLFPQGTTPVTYTATDASGNTSLVCTFTVTVTDNTVPVITLPVPPVVNANAGCQANVPIIAATATDNCSAPGNITISQVPAAGTLIGAGITVITVTATDQAGNSAVSNINVTVVDVTNPVIIPPSDPTINLDNNCQALVPNFLPALVVTDNCTAPAAITRSQNPVAGTVINGTGPTNVIITATDAAGNTSNVTVVVLTQDVTPPAVICRDVTLYLDGTGNATLTGAMVNNGSTDNCTAALVFTLSKTSFNCSNIGAAVPVTLTGTDASGNFATCNSQVTVLDTITPVVNVKAFTLVLGPTGTGTLLPSDVDNGSFDNCGPITLTVAPNTFNCGDQGPHTVTLTATDSHGNSRSRSATIIVGTSLNINSVTLNSCDLAAPFASYNSNVTGGNGTYSYQWRGMEAGSQPFLYVDGTFPFIHFSNTSTIQTPLFNNLMADGTYTIRLVVTDGNGCRDTAFMIMVKAGTTYNNISTRFSTACEGQTKTYTVPFDAAASYSWSLTNGVFTTPTNTNTVDVLWNMGVTEGVVIGNTTKPDLLGNPCGSSIVDSVTVSPTPVPAFSSPVTTACSNSVNTYTLTSTFAVHTWTVTGGTILAGGTAGVNFVTVRWGTGPAGRVSVSVENAATCSASVFVDVIVYNLAGTIISQSNVTCNGLANGSVTAAATAGTGLAPYLYSLDGGATQASGTFNGINPGNHTVRITDALLCTFDIPFTITQPVALLANISSQTNVSCNGSSDGSVTISASGGTAPYLYNIDGGSNQVSNTFTGLAAGAHAVIVTDANLCSRNIPVIITQPTALSGVVSLQDNVDCNGNSNGSVTVTGLGGTPPYQFSLDGGPYQASGNFAGLSAGGYNVMVRDANLCTFNVPVLITEPLVLTAATSSVTNVTCNGGSNGQITIAAGGGTAPYQYNLNGGAYQVSATFMGLTAGVYTMGVRDAELCVTTIPVTVTEPAALVATALSNTPVCETGTITLAGGPNGMATYSWTGPNGFTSLLQNPSIPAATPAMGGVYSLTITSASGCTAFASTNVVIIPVNTVSLTSGAGTNSQTVCVNTAIANISYSTTGATGATVSGLPAGVNGVWAGNVVTISGTPTATGPFNYTVTLTGGCGVITTNGTITVTPANTITLTSAPATTSQTVCINTALTNITYSTTGATGATVTGLPAGVTGVWAGNVVTISGTPTASGPFNYTVTLTGGCGTVTATGTITVSPVNTITLTSAPGTDNQSICIGSTITTITYATVGATGANFIGFPAGMLVSWVANTVTISGTPAAAGVFNYTVNLTGGCGIVSINGIIDVAANNTITLTSLPATTSQSVCVNTAVTNITYSTTGATGATFAGLPAGVTGSWAANIVTISGTPTATGLTNYTVTLTGGCGIATANGTITVTPDNTITLTSAPATTSQTVCVNTPITSITYSTTGATGATVTGLPAGVSGVWAGNVVTISGTPTASGPFSYTVTLTGGCGVITASGTLTVTPANTIALTSAPATTSQTVCVNTAITNITYGTTGATGATVTGLPAGVSGVWAGNVVTISGTPTASGPFNYTVTLTGGCGVVTANGTLTVTPANTIALTSAPATTSQTVCVNTAINNITYSTTGATGATVTGLPAGVNGVWAGNVVTISGTPTASGPFSYTVTLTGGCGVVTANGTITVTPDNTITLTSFPATTAQTVCINAPVTNITYSTTGATGATVTGLPAGVNGVWAGNVVTISGTPTATGLFNYTVTLTGGCGVVTANGTITVTPANTITLTSLPATTSQTVCVSTAITNITYSTTGATGATVTGLPAGVNGVWAANVVTISGTPTASGPFNYTVILTGGCGVVSANGTITVTPDNIVTLTSLPATTSQTVCINTAITNITYSTTGATGATVTGLPAGVNGVWAGNVVTISGTPTASGPFSYTVTLTGGCGVVTATGIITVSPDNTAILTSAAGTDNQIICLGSALTTITYATTGATGAIFAGLPAGMSFTFGANTITISGTPTAFGVFNYSVTLTGGCGSAAVNGTMTVQPNNSITLTSAPGTDFQTTCLNVPMTPITYLTSGATGAIFAGLPAGVTATWAANVVTISGTPTITGPFNYTVTMTGGCGVISTNGTITVAGINTITLTSLPATAAQTVCINAPVTSITYSTTGATGATVTGLPAGVNGVWAGNVVTISGTPTASGPFNYTVTLTGGCGVVTANGTITVTPDNTIALTSLPATTSQTVCVNTAITNIAYGTTGATGATVTGLPAGVNGVWAGNVVTISGTPTASGPFNYTVTLTGGCGIVTASGIITVTPVNTVTLTSFPATTAQTVCINTAIINITYSTTGATGATFAGLPAGVNGVWAGNVVTISGTPTATGLFNYTVTLTGGCGVVTANGTITVTPDNTVTLTSAPATTSQTVCVNTAITNITYSTTGATGATVTGLPAGVNGVWAGNVVTISGTPTASGPFNYTVTLTGGCAVVTANGTITVTPDNTITLTSLPATIAQTVCINAPVTNITYSTTGATGATFIGLPAGVTGSWLANVVTISGIPTVPGPFNYTVTLTGGCGAVIASGTINVTPDNTIILTSALGTDNQTTCINTAIGNITYSTTGATGATITGLPAGVTGNWAVNTVTITGTPTVSGIFNYTVTLTGGCGTVTATGAVTVDPLSTVTLSSVAGTDNQTVCINSAITNIIYTTTGATGATFAGLPAGVIGVWAAGTVTISGTPSVSGTFNYTVTLTGGCGFVTAGGIINVTPDNTISITSVAGTDNQTGCINTAIINITYATAGATGAAVTGLPAGVNSVWASDVVTISGTPSVSGTFNYTVTLTGGCGVATANGIITVTPDNTITLTSLPATTTQTVCASSPITNITYSTTGATGASFAGLPAGVTGIWAADVITISGAPTVSGPFNYTVSLTGGCGIVTSAGTITVNALPVLVITDPAPVCSPSTVDLTAVSVTAGSAAGLTHTYWTDALATVAYLTPAAAITGTYYIKGTDGTGCFDIKPVNATVNATPTASAVVTDVLCFGGSTGSVDLTPAGGTAPYAFLWSNGATTEDINGLITGVYSVTVTDSKGCTAVASGTVNQPVADLAASTVVTNVSCGGTGNDGAVDLTVTGGTGPYTYLWSNGAVTEDISGLIIGNYTVVITDANGCTANSSGNVAGSASIITGSTVVTDVSCFGGNTGAVDLTASGGTAPYTFLWSNGATTEDINGLIAGTYTVLITDAGGCTGNASAIITEPAAALTGTTVVTNVLCFGVSAGAVNLTVNGGTAPYTFLWNTGAITEDLSNVAAANYTVTITDSKGCTAVATGTVAQPAAPLAATTIITNILCNGGTSGAIDLTPTGGTAPYTFLWSNAATTEDISALAAGSYNVKITDANGCFVTVNADITQPAILQVEETHTDAKCPDEMNGSITITVTGGVSPYNVFWSDGVTTLTRSAKDTTYSVVVTDANGCAQNLDVTVGFSEGSSCVMVPAVITPNADGKNDTWIIKNIDLYPNAEVLVYSRWGKTVFKTKNISANPWDGRFDGKLLPTDSYYYILYLNDSEGSKPRTGNVTVIR